MKEVNDKKDIPPWAMIALVFGSFIALALACYFPPSDTTIVEICKAIIFSGIGAGGTSYFYKTKNN